MPAPIYLPQQPYPRQNMFTQLLPQLLMQGLAYKQADKVRGEEEKFREKELERRDEINERRIREARNQTLLEAQLDRRDIVTSEAKQPPEGYVQLPWDSTKFISKERKVLPLQPMLHNGKPIAFWDPNKGELKTMKDLELSYDDKTPTAVKTFENIYYGKEVPEKRGTKSYIATHEKYKKSGATHISLDTKLQAREATAAVDLKSYIKSPRFIDDAAKAVKLNMGAQEWGDIPPEEGFKKDALVFKEVDKRIKESYKDGVANFGERNGVEGWYDLNTGVLIRKWEGYVPVDMQRGIR